MEFEELRVADLIIILNADEKWTEQNKLLASHVQYLESLLARKPHGHAF